MGYLGKISAVVSVNTGDFAAKLNRCKGDVEGFASSTKASLANASRDAGKSFGSIYTEVQKLERALKAASALDFTGLKGFDGKGLKEASDQMRQMHEIASQLSAPLAKTVAAVDAMSHAIKSTLHYAMEQAQGDVQMLQTKMETVGSVTAKEFGKAEEKVRSFAAAAKMAAEATQGASSMGGGGSFRFQRPGLSDEFKRGGQLYGKVDALPAGRVTSELVKLIDLQKAAAANAVKLTTAMAASPSEAAAYGLEATQKALTDINDSIEKVIQSYAAMDAAEAAAGASAAAAAAKRAEADAKWATLGPAGERARSTAPMFESLGANVKRSADEREAREAAEREKRAAQWAGLGAAGKAASGTSPMFEKLGVLAFKQKEEAEKRAAADKAKFDAQAKSEAQSLLRLEQSRLHVMTGEAQSVSQLASQYASVLSRVEKLSAAQKASVAATIAANAGMVEYAISSGTDADVSGVLAEVKAIESAVDAAEDLDVKQKAAKKSADDLLGLQQGYAQSLSGQSQNIAQLRSTYDGLISRFEKLSAAQRATLAAGGFSISADKVQQTLSSGDDSKVAGTQTAVMSMESALATVEDLDAKQKAAKKSSDDLRDSLSKIGDSIGTPAAPIDRAREAIDRMNAAIEKIKDPTEKAKAAAAAAAIRKDIESEVAVSAATGSAPAGSVISGAAQKATSLADATEAVNSRKTADDLFGPMIGTAGRQMDVLKGKISATHSEIEKLPIPIQATLIPEIAKVRAMFMALNDASPQSELDAAAHAAKRLSDNVKNLTNAQQFKGTFGQFLDDTSVKKYQSQLQALQAKLAAIGVSAGGKAAQGVDKFRDALADAAASGQIGMAATNEELDKYIQKIADAAVAEGKMTKAQAKAFVGGVKQAGDISRNGADKASLALNQAAYAIDDFMSSTGGVEQKIRAISNNLTQMAFVLGGTKGLWISLGAVIGAQVAIAFYKFATSGKSAEDTTKALNDALDKQKNTVAELASTYRDLAKSMSMSAAAQKGVDNASVLGNVAKGNYDNRMSRLTGVNSSVVSERAMSAAIQRAMESSSLTSSAGTLIYRNERLKQSQSRERFAEAEARRAPAGRIQDLESMRARRAGVVAQMAANDTARGLEALGLDPRWQAAFADSAKELEALEATIRATEGVIDEWADSLAMSSVVSAQTVKLRIETASNLLASAIEAGVPGARTFQNQMDSLAAELSGALNDLAGASEQTGERRGMESADAKGRVQAVFDRTADLIADTLSYRIEAAFARSGSRDALGQMGGSARFAGGRSVLVGAATRKDVADAQLGVRTTQLSTATTEANRIQAEGRKRVGDAVQDFENAQRQTYTEGDNAAKQRIEADIEAARVAVDSQKQAANASNQAAAADVAAATAARDKAQADAEAADKVDKLAAAAAQAALDMEQFLGRTRKIGEAGLFASEQTADIRQQMFMRRPTQANREARDEAEKQLITDRERVARANAQLDQRRAQAEMDPVVLKATDLITGAQEELAKLQAEAAAKGVAVDPARVRQLQDVEASARADRDRRVFDMTAKERAAQEDIAGDMEAKRQIAEMDQRKKESQAAERARVNQGREDAMSNKDRRVLEASRSAENMAAAAGEFADPVARTAFIQKYFDNQAEEMRKAGPLGQAENERFNAQISGPSRQALNASDITTSDGAKELNRLLRGEDSSRDVNFAEMKQQTELLQIIAEGIKAATGVAVQF
jgi:polyhydroxyalkanoate synthesis regulator phasin